MAWYYGSDLNNATPFPTCTSAAPNFYIGRIGGELTAAGKGASGFDVTAAQDVGGHRRLLYGTWLVLDRWTMLTVSRPCNGEQRKPRHS
jgi:hypothetical protein